MDRFDLFLGAIVAHFKTPLNIVKLTEVSVSFYISSASYPLAGYTGIFKAFFPTGFTVVFLTPGTF